jgi:hypothetical protein
MSATVGAELTQLTAPNETVEAANAVTYAYRRTALERLSSS